MGKKMSNKQKEWESVLLQVTKGQHTSFYRIIRFLGSNDFSDTYIHTILEKAMRELPQEALDDLNTVQEYLLERIGKTIKIYDKPFDLRSSGQQKGRIFVLIGPAGAGKTTAIAKLAAL